MPFADTIRELPFQATTRDGRGFLPPIFRAATHLSFLAACIADENVTVTVPEGLNELRHAQTHWAAVPTSNAISTATNQAQATIGRALDEAITEYEGWTDRQRQDNIRNLVHRIGQFTANCDRELVGLRDSDPGQTL